jgi:hypothetical protein
MARVGEEFPLECPGCGGDIRLILGGGDRAAHNLIHHAPHIAISFNGNDHVLEFNEIHHVRRSRTTRAPCTPALHIDARGLGWAAYHRETLMQRLADMPWQEEPWKSRYPELSGLGKWDEIEATATPFLTLRNNLLGIDPTVVGKKKGGNFWLRVRHEVPRRGRQRRAGDLDDQRRGERRFGEPPPDGRSPRGSRVARQQPDRCRSAFDRAILRHNSAEVVRFHKFQLSIVQAGPLGLGGARRKVGALPQLRQSRYRARPRENARRRRRDEGDVRARRAAGGSRE